jgi:hypothetical protein
MPYNAHTAVRINIRNKNTAPTGSTAAENDPKGTAHESFNVLD